ncbi:hypothetical protein F4802DRAFT_582519 [Xylaria palmicola]|nr:hypothetical protein F4802DRAFT_582519 [Xylaria palmicola]
MPPVTRRAAKAQGNSPTESPARATPTSKKSAAKKETLFEDPIALRSKGEAPADTPAEENQNATETAKAATPRSKKLQVRIREESTSIQSPIAVVIPSSAVKTPRPLSNPVPDSQDEDTAATDEADRTFEPMSASKQLEEEATQKLASQSRLTELGPESTPSAKATRSSTQASSGKKARGKPTPQAEPQPTEAEAEAEATPQPKAAKSTHVVFGDDDDVDKFVAAAAEKEKETPGANTGDKDNEEQEESDDEAPEAVSTAAAAKETLKSAWAAIESAEKLAASTKRKRQARDNLLKGQAEKRKRTKPSTSEKKSSSDDEDTDGEEEGEQKTTSKRQRRTQRLPDMLPAEFLTDSSEGEDDETALKKMVKRPQKINFETAMQVLGAEGKRPRDEVVGSTRYRVLAEQADERLAPKADKNSVRAKDALLRRGRERVALNKKRGFFVKR